MEKRERDLREHVDIVNAELIAAHRRRAPSPAEETRLFRQEDWVQRAKDDEQKRRLYREDLDRQIQEQRHARIAANEREVQLANEANAKAARQ